MLEMSLLGDLFARLGRPVVLLPEDLRLRGEEDPLLFCLRTIDLAAFPLCIF